MTLRDRRFDRQLERMRRTIPGARSALAKRVWWRPALAILLILGGIFSFLPILGVWMLPLGLILLAVDIPRLRPFVGLLVVRFRAFTRKLRRRFF